MNLQGLSFFLISWLVDNKMHYNTFVVQLFVYMIPGSGLPVLQRSFVKQQKALPFALFLETVTKFSFSYS